VCTRAQSARQWRAVFDVDDLTEATRTCLEESEPRQAVRDVLERAVARPEDVLRQLRPETAGITLLHHTPELTIIHVVWAPGMRLDAHDHRMWAVIGIYAGRELNEFYRRPADRAPGLVPSGDRQLDERDVIMLGSETIHAVTNPLTVPTGAIHIYGGDFVHQPRSQWLDPDLVEEPYDFARTNETFARANAGWRG
jgi:predicted metal-dependent enzyme (double-stranded beta helix superfamily)